MSEQDKRPVYMGNFERFKKEMQVKHEDVMLQLALTKKVLRYVLVISGVAMLVALVGLAI
jgi:hypothetical protein